MTNNDLKQSFAVLARWIVIASLTGGSSAVIVGPLARICAGTGRPGRRFTSSVVSPRWSDRRRIRHDLYNIFK
ncbi:MAG: hypothetical protein KAX38_03870 [Candidatus Krumholzibacteria bacterium]|nr:hypothetical protein [Candidatus Krumholzibacteria bacterium]